jgi:hypothetical protein
LRPTLVAAGLKTNLAQHPSTMFTLTEPPVRDGLDKFLDHPQTGFPAASPADQDPRGGPGELAGRGASGSRDRLLVSGERSA